MLCTSPSPFFFFYFISKRNIFTGKKSITRKCGLLKGRKPRVTEHNIINIGMPIFLTLKNQKTVPHALGLFSLSLWCGIHGSLFIHRPFIWCLWGRIFSMIDLSCVLPGKRLISFLIGDCYLLQRYRKSLGFFVFMLSFGLYGRKGIGEFMRIPQGTFLLCGSPFYFLYRAGLNVTLLIFLFF